MKPKEFFDLVADMRKAQKEYFKTPASAYKAKQDALSKSKKLEKQVDDEITRVEKILVVRMQRTLDFDGNANVKQNKMKYNLFIARDKSGELYAYNCKPERYCSVWFSDLSCARSISRNCFPKLKWEDEPLEFELRQAITNLDAKANEYANSVTDNEEIKELVISAYMAGYNA